MIGFLTQRILRIILNFDIVDSDESWIYSDCPSIWG